MIISPTTASNTAHWLLNIEVAGRTYRYATDAIDVPVADGPVLFYQTGLSDLSITESTNAVRSVGVSVTDPTADWALIVSRGGRLGGGKADLYLWFEGTVFEEAMWVAGGLVDATDYGSPWESMEFSITPVPPKYPQFPRPSYQIQSNTVPLDGFVGTFANDNKLGTIYPFVFGQPGKDGGLEPDDRGVVDQLLNFGGQFATPTYVHQWGRFKGAGSIPGIVDGYGSNTLILSGGWVSASNVVVWPADSKGSGGWNDRIDVVQGYDALGQQISYLVANTATRWAFAPDGEYWVSWDSGAGIPIRSADGILRYMLDHVGARVDSAAWSLTESELGGILLDFAVTDSVDPHAWITGHLGDYMPIVAMEGRDGLHYRVIPMTADPSAISMRLDGSDTPSNGVPVRRAGKIQFGSDREVVNQVTIDFARTARDGYSRSITLSPDSSYASTLSYHRYGLRTKRINCDVAWDSATATALGAALLKWKSLPRRSLSVQGSMQLLRAPLLSIVTYSEEEAHMSSELAVVLSRRITLSGVTLDLMILDQPGQQGWAS